jgi:hypothetical protein
VPPLLLLAQCTPSAPCELAKGLPWYFGLVIAGLWLVAVTGAVVIGRRYLQQKIRRRRRRSDSGRRRLEQTTPGHDLEPW